MKKMLKTTLALVLSFAMLLTFAACGNEETNSTSKPGNSNTQTNTGNTGNTGSSYTKGAITDGKYVNKWADLQVTISGDLANASAEDYASFEDAKTESGLVLTNDDRSKQLAIVFEKLEKSISDEEYLNVISTALKSQYESIFGKCDVSNYEATVAGRTYASVKISIENALTQTIHVRIVDGYAIAVLATAQNNFDAAAIIANVQAAN